MPEDATPLPEWMVEGQKVVRVRMTEAPKSTRRWVIAPEDKNGFAAMWSDSGHGAHIMLSELTIIPHPQNHEPWVSAILAAGGTKDE